jgi:hypothetical protein
MSKLQKFMQLTKVDVAKKLIYGTFTAEVVDKSGEVADYETTKKAMQEWSADIEKASQGKSLGNIRKMHGKEVCGKAVEIVYDDANKAIHGCVEADDVTINEADKGFLNGFSIGGSYAKKWADPVHKGKTRFTPVIAEISVVDNPCVPDAVFSAIKDASFTVVKEDGTEELRKFAPKEVEKELSLKQVWQADDGSTHETKDAAVKANAAIMAKGAAKGVQDILDKADKAEDDNDNKEEAAPEDKKKGKIKMKAKKAADGELEKGLGQVARLACIIEDLNWLATDMEWEQEYEGDKSKAAKWVKQTIVDLIEILKEVVIEETDEMTVENAAGLTENQVAALRKVAGEVLKEWKAPVVSTKSDELQKVSAERDALAKQLADLTPQIEAKFDALTKRIKVLEAQPAPDEIKLTTLVKGGEDVVKEQTQEIAYVPRNASPAERRQIMNR